MKMPGPSSGNEELAELMRTFIIVQLGLEGLPQQTIRKLVGCDINRVNAIVKNLPKSRIKRTKE